MRLHWYPWDPAAFAMSTMRWSYEEKGYYRDALDLSWTQDGLDDIDWLPERVQRKFELAADGRWRNARQERDRAEQAAKHELRASAGRRGGLKKSSNATILPEQNPSNATAMLQPGSSNATVLLQANAKQNPSNQNQNQNQNKISSIEENSPLPPRGESAAADEAKPKPTRSKLSDFPEDFQKVWNAASPESRARSGILDAFKAWGESGAAKEPERALKAISAASQTKSWKEGFAPGLHRWLKSGGWMVDDIASPSLKRGGTDGYDYLEGSRT